MKSVLATLSLLAVTTFAVPIVPSTTVMPAISPSTPNKLVAVPRVKPRKVDLPAPARSPYRFQMAVSNAATAAATKRSSPVDTKASAPTVANSEKNWLLTKAWLIDNINRIRFELKELERDYSNHLVKSTDQASQKEKQFIEDIAKLRADHTVLSQQQKQIIYLIKRNQILRARPISENDIHYTPLSSKAKAKSLKVAGVAIKRQIKRDLTQTLSSEHFEAETRRNMKELFVELSSLHDITLTLFDKLRNVEHKMENRDKFK